VLARRSRVVTPWASTIRSFAAAILPTLLRCEAYGLE
jgi:hypothetical protein